jgi:hypothetical protein
MGSPRHVQQAVESVACVGSHRLASSGARAGTDVTLVDPGGNASLSTAGRERGGSGQQSQTHTRAASGVNRSSASTGGGSSRGADRAAPTRCAGRPWLVTALREAAGDACTCAQILKLQRCLIGEI